MGSDRRNSVKVIGLITIILIDQIYVADANPHSDGPVIDQPKNEIILQNGQNFTLYCKGKRKVELIKEPGDEIITSNFSISQRTVEDPSDSEYMYHVALDMINVDEYAIGYYACVDDTVTDKDSILQHLTAEPINTEHITYFYVYVNATNVTFAPMKDMINAYQQREVIIKCRPTTPDIPVELEMPKMNQTRKLTTPKIGFIVDNSKKIPHVVCSGTPKHRDRVSRFLKFSLIGPPVKPSVTVKGGSYYFLPGETFTLNCTVKRKTNTIVTVGEWYIPNTGRPLVNETNELEAHPSAIVYHSITVVNATKADAGLYTCHATSSYNSMTSSRFMTMINEPHVNVSLQNPTKNGLMETSLSKMTLSLRMNSHPPDTNLTIYKNGIRIPSDAKKPEITHKSITAYTVSLYPLNLYDTGNYTFVVENIYKKANTTLDFRVLSKPIIHMDEVKVADVNSQVQITCNVEGYPLPTVQWYFVPADSDISEDQLMAPENEYTDKAVTKNRSIYELTSYIKITAKISGNLTCVARNNPGNRSAQSISRTQLIVYAVPEGFGIQRKEVNWFPEYSRVTLLCYASRFRYSYVGWENTTNGIVSYHEDVNSLIANLTFDSIRLEDAAVYTCSGESLNGTVMWDHLPITVAETLSPQIVYPVTDVDMDVYPYQIVELTCMAQAIPQPTIEWFKDGYEVRGDDRVSISSRRVSHTTVNSTLKVNQMSNEYKGKYECSVTSGDESAQIFYSVFFKEKHLEPAYIAAIVVIFTLLVILVLYLVWKVRKEKRFRKELAAAGLLYFKEGMTKSLNPDLGIFEQAELLPYDDKFEFPASKLQLGKQLGAGAFGVVYKAEARGIIDAEQTTTVAVKMVKKTADNMYIKALASELKIMVHLGKHVNIVNLLGACTNNVGKRELIVIVEYCKFGNLHNYLQKHRSVFIDQFGVSKDKSGGGKENQGFSHSSVSSGNQSEYYGSGQSQHTDNTFLNTANSNRSSKKLNIDETKEKVAFTKVSESGYLQPEWRSNYESDYTYEGRQPRPLFSRDLVCWAFQIARGMEYLTSRKVMHGDLAARNVLLAEDNVVKICDFGLARSIYKNDEYRKTEDGPLPIKWLAPECMTERIFSTQSDVWSFGVVMWELFSLAQTPYAGLSKPQDLVEALTKGERLGRPLYADARLYSVMRECWAAAPRDRPSFASLQQTLGDMLDNHVRNHYVELDEVFAKNNASRASVEDYLAMSSAPDYTSQVTPSAHHYMNENTFFPDNMLQHDSEGYLQMSPARRQAMYSTRGNPAAHNSADIEKNPELTPMLTLNNVSSRSSDSEHSSHSPYLNMCPRIEEEADDVFEDVNEKNKLNSAVSNPTYITFDNKANNGQVQNKAVNYVNVGHNKNGLVK